MKGGACASSDRPIAGDVNEIEKIMQDDMNELSSANGATEAPEK